MQINGDDSSRLHEGLRLRRVWPRHGQDDRGAPPRLFHALVSLRGGGNDATCVGCYLWIWLASQEAATSLARKVKFRNAYFHSQTFGVLNILYVGLPPWALPPGLPVVVIDYARMPGYWRYLVATERQPFPFSPSRQALRGGSTWRGSTVCALLHPQHLGA